MDLLPAFEAAVTPQLDVSSVLLRIIDEEVLDQTSIPAVTHRIKHRIMTEIPRAHEILVHVRTRFPKDLLYRMLHADFFVHAHTPLTTFVDETTLPHENSETDWELPIALHGHTHSNEQKWKVVVSISWPTRMTESNHVLAREYNAPSGHTNPFPTFAIHRQIGDFIESRVHENLDVLAFDAASLFFQNSERSIGFSPSITFFLRFTALSDLVEGTGRLNRTYRFTRQWYQAFQRARHTFETERAYSRAFIALGSNIGDRLAMIDQACSELTRRGLKVRHTSSLYETEAMYKTDQQRFVNGVCEVRLPPLYADSSRGLPFTAMTD